MKKLILSISALILAGSAFADNAIQDIGNAVGDTVQGVGNAVGDVAHGTANAVSDVTTTNGHHNTRADHSNNNNVLQQMGQSINDAAITATIYANYTTDPLLNPLQINVETNNGEVTLKGNVDADAQYERAMQIAANTNGVKDVNGRDLTVTPSHQFFADSYITLEVKMALLRSQYFDSGNFNTWNIHVETNNGVVYLIGNVADNNAQNRIIEIAKSINGVQDVKTDLSY